MIKTSIVLVHGMGPHKKGWSNDLQTVLKKELPSISIKAKCYETLYSDLVENSREIMALSSMDSRVMAADPGMPDMQEAIANLKKMQADFDSAYRRSARATAVDKGVIGDGVEIARSLLRYVAGYLWTGLRQKVDARINETIADVLAEQDDRQLIIIGHSLGSVVSYCLATQQGSPAENKLYRLITLGSPLGAVASFIKLQQVPCRWGNASAPGDVVSTVSIDEPPFSADGGLVSLKTRKPAQNPHGSLLRDSDIIRDWIPLLI